MKQLLFLCAFVLCFHSLSFGQQQKPKTNYPKNQPSAAQKSDRQRAPLFAEIQPPQNSREFVPMLSPVISANPPEQDEVLLAYKKAQSALKKVAANAYPEEGSEDRSAGLTVTLGRNFQGNSYNGCPPDNTVAVSNGGWVVSLVNSNIYMFSQSGTLFSAFTLYDFYKSYAPTISNRLCDPKIIYDVVEDRFIFYSQVCDGVPANSEVILAFSKTNNPTGSWNIYRLTGNPLQDGSWFDYPKIGLSAKELYVTGNLYSANGTYKQSVLYQIPKSAGYQGQTLNWQYWYNIEGSPFTLLPLSWGQGASYGPGVYLVATQSGGGGLIKFYDLTDYMSASNEKLVYKPISTDWYFAPPNAIQPHVNDLSTGDSRTMDGFYLNKMIHLVFSVNQNAWSAIRYYRINVETLKPQYFTIHHEGVKDYGYPSVASFSNSNSDQSAIVSFLASGGSDYPEIRAKPFDNSMNTTASLLVRKGDSPMADCYDSKRAASRWGDYSGIARKHNASQPTVWVTGCFGKWNTWSTWVAELYGVNGNGQDNGAGDRNNIQVADATAYPNPANEVLNFEFEAPSSQEMSFHLWDMQGRPVATVYQGAVAEGRNTFSFSTSSLPTGRYVMVVQDANQKSIYRHENIVVAR